MPFQRVAFIGLGLIGGSMAKRVRQALPQTEIAAIDTQSVLDSALAMGVIHQPFETISQMLAFEPDLIILGTHLHPSYALLQELATHAQQPLDVMDLGSVKAKICQMAESLPETIDFIGGHPLAGREISGFEQSREDLFLGKRFLLTPCLTTSEPFQAAVMSWLEMIQMVPMVMEPVAHDQLMALVSHFPQFYAIALANLINEHQPETTLRFLGGGIDDQMRLMASPENVWEDIFDDNQTHLLDILDQFSKILETMKQSVKTGQLRQHFETSHQVHALYKSYKMTVSP